jgi:peroxiredoxin
MILEALTLPADRFEERTGWAIKPQGACKGDACVPLPGDVRNDDGTLNARPLAERLSMPLVEDAEHGLWALGPESGITGRALTTAEAPDLELPDLAGNPFRLSSLRGQKVVVACWASWCGCREDLSLWQALREELHPKGLEVVTVALDTGGPDAARQWIQKANPQHPSLVDAAHIVDERLGVVNVPNALWIDEEGMIVRPAEPSWLLATKELDDIHRAQLPPDHAAVFELVEQFNIDASRYPAMLRDWVEHGAESRFVLAPDEVIARSQPRSMDASLAAAHFELAQHLHRAGDHDASVGHFKEAHRLQPENWTYKRQAWNLEAPDSVATIDAYGTGWLQEVRKHGPERYYPQIES